MTTQELEQLQKSLELTIQAKQIIEDLINQNLPQPIELISYPQIGDKFRCRKDVFMNTGDLAYKQHHIYYCDAKHCITDDSGDQYHLWTNLTELAEYFEKIN